MLVIQFKDISIHKSITAFLRCVQSGAVVRKPACRPEFILRTPSRSGPKPKTGAFGALGPPLLSLLPRWLMPARQPAPHCLLAFYPCSLQAQLS